MAAGTARRLSFLTRYQALEQRGRSPHSPPGRAGQPYGRADRRGSRSVHGDPRRERRQRRTSGWPALSQRTVSGRVTDGQRTVSGWQQ